MADDPNLPRALRPAFGAPGIPPRWTRSAKDAVGTAYSAASEVWFTLAQGTLTEVYYPRLDEPQVRDLQFLVGDGTTFFSGERRDCTSRTELLSANGLGFRIVTEDRQGRFRWEKEIVTDPHLSCLLVRARLIPGSGWAHRLHAWVLCAPHLRRGGSHNNAGLAEVSGRPLLLAWREPWWLALSATVPLLHRSCGFVGASDGWSDLAADMRQDWEFDSARDGNLALMAELDLHAGGGEFTLALSFGPNRPSAVNTLLQSLGQPFARARDRFIAEWDRVSEHKLAGLRQFAHDGGQLYDRSVSLLLAHEDKRFPGALIASLSIPWGEVKGDDDLGGYHLVWTRDLQNSAGGLLASGDRATPLRALIYLASVQREDGGFAQNFWVDGRPYWSGIQLDEVAAPIMGAWKMRRERALGEFDPYPMVLRAAGFLMRRGPFTQQERWEEAGGYSPSTLANHIAGLVCAAEFAHERHDAETATLCRDYADFLESHIERWTVTRQGTLVPGIREHYVRINPAPMRAPGSDEDLETAELHINNRAPGERQSFPARDIVDAGFLELVRLGIRAPGDPLIENSLRVVDAVLKVETPFGPCWRRYNHDGYGQQPGGLAFNGWGVGRAWPLLTGERGHYEFAAGRPVEPYLRALERLANHLGMLPEQVWDEPDVREQFLYFGRPTGSAMPLMWAHAEYIKLLRTRADGAVFDLLTPVADRYLRGRARTPIEIWQLHRQVPRIRAGDRLRLLLPAAFWMHGSRDGWKTIEELRSHPTRLGFEYLDLMLRPGPEPFRFTLRWVEGDRWQGEDYAIAVDA